MIPQIEPLPKGNSAIIHDAQDLWLDYARAFPEMAMLGMSFRFFYEEFIYPKFEILLEERCDLNSGVKGAQILGKYLPTENVALLDECLEGDPRKEFVCWHEVAGHGILQGEWIRRQMRTSTAEVKISTTEKSMSIESEARLERQANIFASNLAVPTPLLRLIYQRILGSERPVRYTGPGSYSLSCGRGTRFYRNVKTMFDLAWRAASHLQIHFGRISKEMLAYRLIDTGLIEDHSPKGFELHRKSVVQNQSNTPIGEICQRLSSAMKA